MARNNRQLGGIAVFWSDWDRAEWRAFLLGNRFRMGILRKMVVYALLTFCGAVLMLPFFWMVSTALKPAAQVFSIPPRWIPQPLVWQNFPDSLVYTGDPWWLFLWNTTQIAVVGTVGTVLSSATIAYGFARLQFPGRDALFLLVLSTLMLPFSVTMIPTFILYRELGWLNTFYPFFVAPWLGVGAFNIFLLRQFFRTIPIEYDEAALIEGASRWTIFWRIILPLSRPGLATVAVFHFIYAWNDFLAPLIYLSSREKFTLSLFLANFQVPLQPTPWNLYMAAATIFMLPSLVLFFVAQQYFMEGINIGGIKG